MSVEIVRKVQPPVELEEKISFSIWWARFLHLAEQNEWPVDPDQQDAYREYYDDGDTPEQALDDEMEYWE